MAAVSIIIPTLNESENIASLVDRIFSVMRDESIATEIIIVDDGSTDGTREKVADLETKYPLLLKCRDNKKGLASAVVEGAHSARYETVVVMDGDFSHSPEDIPRLVLPMYSEQKDMVIGSRYTPGGETPHWPLRRKIASKVASFPAQNLTGVDDPLSGFFAVSRDTLRSVNPDVLGYKICLEVLLGQDKAPDVKEVPISFRDRVFGNSKMTKAIIQSYFLQLIDLCGLGVPSGFWRAFLPILFTGILADTVVYWICILLGATPFLCHASAFISSLTVIVLAFQLLHPKKTSQGASLFGLSALVALFLIWLFRIGVFAFIEASSLDPIWPFLPGLAATIFSTSTVSYVFSMKVFKERRKTINQVVSFRIKLMGVIAASFALRFLFAGSFELLKEEAYYWVYAQHLDIGYLDHPPMVAYLIYVGTTLLGDSEIAVRIGAIFSWGLATCFAYRYAREISCRDNALQAAAIVSVIPAFFMYGLFMTPDAPLIACWAGTLFFLRRSLVDLDKKSWVGVGICLGLGMFSKYTITLLGPAILTFLIIDKTSRHLLIRPYPYGAAVLALLIFSPVILWNMDHEWASFLFQTQNRLEASSEFSTHEMLAFIIILLSPVGFAAALFFLFCRKKIIKSHETTNRNYLFAFTLTVVPLLIFSFFSLTKEVKFNWTSPVWLAGLPFMAMTLSKTSRILQETTQIRFLKSWKVTILVFLLAYGSLFQFFAIGIPGLPYSGGGPLWAWDKYTLKLDELVDSIEKQTGKRPVMVGMDQYKTASGLAFYRTRNREQGAGNDKNDPLSETVGRNIVGNRSAVMYDFWFNPSAYKDRPLILVSPSRSDLNDIWITADIENIGDIELIETTRNGAEASPLLYRLANVPELD